MSTNPPYRLWLAIRFWITRLGFIELMCLATCASAFLLYTAVLPYVAAVVENRTELVEGLTKATERNRVATVPRSYDDERLSRFYDILAEREYAEQQVKTMFAAAAKAGISLSEADYSLAPSASGHYSTYQITVPVRGTYASIREFAQQLLLSMPFASLDQIEFKRDAISNRTLQGKLRITLYLKGQSQTSQLKPAQAIGGAE